MTTEASERPETDLPTGEVTFLFTDIEGSTRLSQTLGDAFSEVIDRHHRLLRETIAESDGVVVSTEGDAFFAVFTDPLQAIIAAGAAQHRLAREPWPGDAAVRVRMGVHTGSGRLGGDDYAGVEVNRGSRIAAAGHGGQVLLSESTSRAVADALPAGLSLRDLGAIMLRDFEEPQSVAQLEIDGLPSAFPPLRADRPGNLPQPLTSFLGRDTVADAVRLVREQRLVTLTGPGGTGKTRISIEAARQLQSEYRGGAWFVPLETIRERALVLPEIADRVGIPAAPGRPALDVLAAGIGDRPTLIVLDNLEQVVAAGPDLVQLLERTPGLRILASSREPLRVGPEQELPVPVLDADLAVELFIERARRVRPSFEPSAAERKQLSDLTARLDHLPLAIELAAARSRHLSVAALSEQVPAALVDLDSGRRDAVDRQRTLRGAVAWSYDLLDAGERRTFDRLAVFEGGAAFEFVPDVIDPEQPGFSIVGDLETLADKSLLAIGEGPDGGSRVRMLETIRAYAVERFELTPDRGDVRRRHAQRFLAFCESIEPELMGRESDVALARMEAEHDNVRAALRWSAEHEPALGLRIGGAIWRFWQQRGHMEEAQAKLEALFAVAGEETDRHALGRGSTGLGGIRYWQGDHVAARAAYEDAIEHYRASGDEADLASAYYDLAYPVGFLGDRERAAELAQEALRRFEAIGDQVGASLVKEAQAVLAAMRGDDETAAGLQREVVAQARQDGGLFRLADNLDLLAVVEARLGNVAEARALLEEIRDVQRRLHDRSSLVGGLEVRALLAAAEGDDESAALCLGAIEGMRDRSPNMLVPSETLGIYSPGAGPRARLGERFDVLFEAGRAMDPEEVFLTDGLAAQVE